MTKSEFIFNGEVIETALEKDGDIFKVQIGDKTIELIRAGQNLFQTNFNSRKTLLAVARKNDTYYIDIDSVLIEVTEPSQDGYAGGAGDGEEIMDKIFAPMPGKIVKIQVEVGQAIDIKQPMVIVEAMKMENQVIAKAKGKVKAVNFKVGDQVDTETPIIELELEE